MQLRSVICRTLPDAFCEDNEYQLGSPRQPEALVGERKGPFLTSLRIAAAIVVSDELAALLDDRHLDHVRAKVRRGCMLGGCNELFAEPRSLSSRIHGKQTQVRHAVLLSGDLDTADDVGSVESDEDSLVGVVDDFGERFGIGALAVEEIGFVRPALTGGVAAVGTLDQGVERGNVSAPSGTNYRWI